MNTTKHPEVRIRVTPLRRLRGDTYVPRTLRAVPAQPDDEALRVRSRERPTRPDGGRRPACD
ncbi:hypothetical protein OG418_44210 [Streptomyces phaeochromogenes]|uniref:Uncharacterized protein n=1 Tax=Streptomyces phaeochromogenes TaxID=1923 RepID=A0ABZ1H5Y8_STRPH|nr:hypothetical protein [Streptomyces phaeochromogenes]MCX5603381.1 hypothetical protein [Streptomyces phaeochromogenes]WRZ27221.1 hypothetical protein OG931_05400 [Streptomyces phaeochromogenes]WSD12786.1 hypothetical protein OHB35_05810 [Streptomyces phaeochromogenes]WSJ10419.1 hypothetical protein OG437_45755 [Streptomyces phaeochromogenes]